MTDKDLMYAATARCRCGAGLAHPLDHDLAVKLRAWVCSAVLKGDGIATSQGFAALRGEPPTGDHDSLDFAFFKVREETSINNTGGHTTRPAVTVLRTVGRATCPACKHEWSSEPYSACGANHHWFPGPCPNCGHAVGGAGTYRSGDGPRIETRYLDVVVEP